MHVLADEPVLNLASMVQGMGCSTNRLLHVRLHMKLALVSALG